MENIIGKKCNWNIYVIKINNILQIKFALAFGTIFDRNPLKPFLAWNYKQKVYSHIRKNYENSKLSDSISSKILIEQCLINFAAPIFLFEKQVTKRIH